MVFGVETPNSWSTLLILKTRPCDEAGIRCCDGPYYERAEILRICDFENPEFKVDLTAPLSGSKIRSRIRFSSIRAQSPRR
jgi:hypothetical protein